MTGPSSTTLGLAPARVVHEADGLRAADYADVYCARAGGLDESEHVFQAGNDLPARFAALSATACFTIGETGFGTGRNMLAAWRLFEETAPASARLNLFSIEGHPLRVGDLSRVGTDWPGLAAQMARLIGLWPAPVRGLHHLVLSSRVTLDLYLGDVADGLARFDGRVDAWFLDGFAPARNPAMWSSPVLAALAAKSAPGATVATYSVARVVRDGLTDAGFVWWRRPGFADKRHCLAGRLDAPPKSPNARPWFSRLPPAPAESRIAVVGAGIAGTTVAEALARRGRRVHVYDRAGPASGASGNRAAALNPRLAVEATVSTRFDLAALGYAGRWLAARDPARRLWDDCGLLQLARSDRELERQARMLAGLAPPEAIVRGVAPAEASRLAGMSLDVGVQGALYFPGGISVTPVALCHALIAAPGIRYVPRDIQTMTRRDAQWHLVDDAGDTAIFDHVVLASAGAAPALCADLPPLRRVRGQTSNFVLDPVDAAFSPDCVVCEAGYVLPARNGRQVVGATYAPRARDLAVSSADHEANHAMLQRISPPLAAATSLARAEGRASWRCISHDRLPLVGGVPDVAAWRRDYASLAKDASVIPPIDGALWPEMSVSLAYGSHGMLRAPLAAEMLASRLAGEPAPVERDVVEALHPGRWLIRQIIRDTLARADETA